MRTLACRLLKKNIYIYIVVECLMYFTLPHKYSLCSMWNFSNFFLILFSLITATTTESFYFMLWKLELIKKVESRCIFRIIPWSLADGHLQGIWIAWTHSKLFGSFQGSTPEFIRPVTSLPKHSGSDFDWWIVITIVVSDYAYFWWVIPTWRF